MNQNFRKYVEGKRVVIVGPAPSIVGSKQKELIDSYDIVVRVNKALPLPQKLVSDIGSRCDVLYNCLNTSPECGGVINFKVLEKLETGWVVCPYPPISPFKKDIVAFSQRVGIEKPGIKVRHIDTTYYKKHADPMKTRPNSGIGAILDLLSFDIKELYITGFTFFKGGYYTEYRNKNEKQVMAFMDQYKVHSQNSQKAYMKGVLLGDKRVRMDEALRKVLMG